MEFSVIISLSNLSSRDAYAFSGSVSFPKYYDGYCIGLEPKLWH